MCIRDRAYNERLACKLYIDCMATGSEHAISRIDSTLILYEGCIGELNYRIADDPDYQVLKNEKAMFEFLVDILYDLKTKAQNGEYDYQTILNKLECVENYFNLKHNTYNLEYVLSEDIFDEYAQRYAAGEDIESVSYTHLVPSALSCQSTERFIVSRFVVQPYFPLW